MLSPKLLVIEWFIGLSPCQMSCELYLLGNPLLHGGLRDADAAANVQGRKLLGANGGIQTLATHLHERGSFGDSE